MSGPLDGVRIVDLTAMITGPMATMILADQGAEVVKIEPPGIGDVMRYLGSQRGGLSAIFASCNRGKRSVVVNLKDERGRAIVRDLVRQSHVFIQNFRPGAIARLGLDEPSLRADDPELVYVSLSAFGEKGPEAERPAYDHILQGLTAAPYVQGDPPQFMRQTWCDKATAVMAAQAISAALFARERGRGGQHLRLSMLDVALSFLWPDGHADTMLLEEDAIRLPGLVSTYEPVVTADGFAAVVAVTEQQWTGLLRAVGKEDLLVDPRFDSGEKRLANLHALRAELGAAAAQLSTEALVARLRDFDVPGGPILRPEDVPGSSQVVASETLVTSEHPVLGRVREPRPPARFDRTPAGIRRPAPRLGEHTDAVLAELDRDALEIADLRGSGVLG